MFLDVHFSNVAPSITRNASVFPLSVPHQVLAKWIVKDTMINQVEACAGSVALDTWSNLLVGLDCSLIDSETF